MAERKELIRQVLKRQAVQAKKSAENAQAETSDLAQLHQQLGNQAVQGLMKSGRLQLSGSSVLQAKLTVTPAGDQYEQEADQTANQVVNGPQPVQRAGEEDELQMSRIQRAGEEDELQMSRIQRAGEEDELQMQRIQRAGEEDELQMKRDDPAAGFDVQGGLEQSIQTERGNGQSMPDQSRGFFESGFGQDFSGVRVHTDQKSDELNQSLSAKAFTVGSDIFFRSGTYNPDNQAGKELIAHELTHVVQQGGSKVQKKKEDD